LESDVRVVTSQFRFDSSETLSMRPSGSGSIKLTGEFSKGKPEV